MCTIQLKRESRFGYGARRIHVHINGVREYSIENGGARLHLLPPGKHKISFFLGRNLLSDIMLSIDKETESTNIIFWITNVGDIEVVLSNNSIEHSVAQRKTNSSGLYILLGFVITLLFLLLLGVRIIPVIYLFPIS